MKLRLTLLTTVCSVLLGVTIMDVSESYAQDLDLRMRNEVTESNGLMMYKGRPYTGTVFETSSSGVKLFDAGYLNGRRNGRYTEKHSNGKLKFEAVYNNGKLSDGSHSEFNAAGGKVSTKTVKGGNLVREEFYTAGKLTRAVDYRADGTMEKETPYSNGLKNGEVKHYDGAGRITSKEMYMQDALEMRLILEYHSNGKLRTQAEVNANGIKNGIVEEYFPAGGLSKKSRYENGIEREILEEHADPNTTVGKLLGNGRYIYMCDRFNGTDTVYVMVTFDSQGGEVQTNILSRLNGRMKQVNADNLDKHRHKGVRYEVNFKNPRTGTLYVEPSTLFGLTIPAGYKGTASVECTIKDLRSNNTVRTKTLTGETNRFDDRNSAQSNAASAVKGAMIDQMAYGFFTLSGRLTGILESNRKGMPTRVEVDLGSVHNLGNGVLFNVYEQAGESKRKVGLLVLQDVLGEFSSRCKVKDGEDVIKRLMDSGKPIYVEAKFDF